MLFTSHMYISKCYRLEAMTPTFKSNVNVDDAEGVIVRSAI